MRDLAAKAATKDHYAILAIHWSAYDELIEQAYYRERLYLNRGNYPANLSVPDQENLELATEAVQTAYSTLIDIKSRRQFRSSLVDKMNLTSGVRLYMDKGDTAVLQGDRESARSCFRRVVELDPNNRQAHSKLRALGLSFDTD